MDEQDLTDFARLHNLFCMRPLRMETVHEGFHYLYTLRFGVADRVRSLSRVHGERLFAQDMLAGVRSFLHPFRMQMVRKRKVHRIDLGIGKESFVGAE